MSPALVGNLSMLAGRLASSAPARLYKGAYSPEWADTTTRLGQLSQLMAQAKAQQQQEQQR